MTDNNGEIIISLNEKIKHIISLYEAEKKKNEEILYKKTELAEQLSENKENIIELEKKYNTLKLAKNVLISNADSHDAKTKINRIVREIDNCIALLNR